MGFDGTNTGHVSGINMTGIEPVEQPTVDAHPIVSMRPVHPPPPFVDERVRSKYVGFVISSDGVLSFGGGSSGVDGGISSGESSSGPNDGMNGMGTGIGYGAGDSGNGGFFIYK
jgi:hypothetical protein